MEDLQNLMSTIGTNDMLTNSENYIMHYDSETGFIMGYYLKSWHGDNIPSPNIEITPDQHLFLTNNEGKYKINVETLEVVTRTDGEGYVFESMTNPMQEQMDTMALQILTLMGV